jgi:sugar phosphate isomerase/epimerase
VRLATVARDHGVTLAHENCHGWAASDPERALALVEATRGEGFGLLHDVGNPVYNGHDGLEYLRRTIPHVVHVHVKDARATHTPAGERRVDFTWPGEGEARVAESVTMLVRAGYGGVLSIEPHLAFVPHDPTVKRSDEERRAAYLEYGRRMHALLGDRVASASTDVPQAAAPSLSP